MKLFVSISECSRVPFLARGLILLVSFFVGTEIHLARFPGHIEVAVACATYLSMQLMDEICRYYLSHDDIDGLMDWVYYSYVVYDCRPAVG